MPEWTLVLLILNLLVGAGTLVKILSLAAEWGQFKEKVQQNERRIGDLEETVFSVKR